MFKNMKKLTAISLVAITLSACAPGFSSGGVNKKGKTHSTKICQALQRAAKEQLNVKPSFGESSGTCGLSQSEFKALDMDKVDFSEVIEELESHLWQVKKHNGQQV